MFSAVVLKLKKLQWS